MSMKKIAEAVFRQPLNCAQAVAHAWTQKTGADVPLVAKLSGCGGGRAPGGVCGALHAVHCIAGEEALRKQALADFSAMAGGAADCRSIKSSGVPCSECVAFAAGWVEQNIVVSKGRDGAS